MSTVMYAGTTEGVFTIEGDNGAWEIRSKGLGEWEVSDIAVVPGSSNTILAGTRGDGVLVSEDAGKSWKKPNRGRSGPGKVKCVTISPHDPAVWYAGTEPIGVWVTRDSGEHWENLDSLWDIPSIAQIDYPVPAVEPHVRDIVVDPSDADTIYASLQVGYMAKTVDGGRTWAMVNDNVDADIHVVVARPDDPRHVYISTGGHDRRLGHSPGRALYETLDGGESWRPMAMEFEQEYSVPLAMHPLDPDVLYSALAFGPPPLWNREGGAQSTLVRSNDGGASWHPANTGFEEVERDYVETITFDQSAPDHIYIGTRQGGVFTSRDAGESWSKVEVDLPEITELRVISTDEASG